MSTEWGQFKFVGGPLDGMNIDRMEIFASHLFVSRGSVNGELISLTTWAPEGGVYQRASSTPQIMVWTGVQELRDGAQPS